eukprot:CAMPEP_0202895674 /NCGR_PEP_ID=MMETSP1392-20130828/4834_1 /ASSEMBLY_ACC=CAM_ASM_000868 /TAXON_ID=225041 /ORGANISM="Chlamydomonas chlamydogama, Strain SAG 11-48b" /LENGTH=400 /DNA_ID=CAMNT_0049580775 /DNA_START=275 /DNA_END=1477 /DNA_ORIENTATION=+
MGVSRMEQQAAEAASQAPIALYNLAEAASTASTAVQQTVERKGGFLAPLSDGLETVLRFLQNGLDAAHVPYSYGYSIILLTMLVKLATYPLTKQQVESSLAVQSLKPRVDLIKARFGDDKDKIQKETSLLYQQAGVNPLAGCLPTLATIPIFIGLYNSLTNAANEGLFDTQGFYWIPSLAGPTTMAARQDGSGTEWLFPFVNGAPPIGWEDALCYLSLPALLILTQYISTAIISPPLDPEDPNANTTRALYAFLPLMIGYFSLNVPAGLSLYYLSNSVLTTLVQIYLKKLGGANVVVNDLGPVTKPGSGRRTGEVVMEFAPWTPTTVSLTPPAEEEEAAPEQEAGVSTPAPAAAAATSMQAEAKVLDPATVSHRVKRKKLSLILQQQGVRPATAAAQGSA